MLGSAAITPGRLSAGRVRQPEAWRGDLIVNGRRRPAIVRPPSAQRAGNLPWVARAYPRYARFPRQKGRGVMTQVTEHLETHGVPFEPIAHPQAYTSIDEARALGIEASEVLKTVAIRAAGGSPGLRYRRPGRRRGPFRAPGGRQDPVAEDSASPLWPASPTPQGGCSPSRPILSASAAPCDVKRSPS